MKLEFQLKGTPCIEVELYFPKHYAVVYDYSLIARLDDALCFTSAYYIRVVNGYEDYPDKVYCYKNFATETKNAVHNACATWNAGGQGDLVYYTSATHSKTKYPIFNSKNQITKGARGEDEYLMQTTAYLNDDEDYIVEADIDINSSFAWKNDGSSDAYDVQNTMTHELGHLLGIGDCSVKKATMYWNADTGETLKRTLYSDDKYALKDIYGE